MDFASTDFWIAVLQIIAIDLVLSGDNAVVIALACRNLPEAQRKKGVMYGVAGAIGLRVVLTAFAASVLTYPWLKLCGGLLLLWIGVKLLVPEEGSEHDIQGASNLTGAVKTIIIADAVMSLDNVIAVAAAAKDSLFLLLFGLAVSIPLIMWSSHLMLHFMERYPVIITLGAGLLGYVAGDMIVRDAIVANQLPANLPALRQLAGISGALLVVGVGLWLARRRQAAVDRRIV
jgi:YjbE family integral membrane protein